MISPSGLVSTAPSFILLKMISSLRFSSLTLENSLEFSMAMAAWEAKA